MIDLKEFTRLKNKVQEAQQRKDKAEGALSQIKARLKKEFGCSSLKQAKLKLKDMSAEEKKLTKQYDQKLVEFNKWEEQLEENE